MVLELLMDGHLNKIIAAQLGMSIRTAEHPVLASWRRWAPAPFRTLSE